MSINDRLREERLRLGFNQQDFAALGDASLRSQIEWEKGNAFPNAKVLAAMAQAGADVQYILTGIRSASAGACVVLRQDQQALLDNMEHCSKEDRDVISRMAFLMAKAKDDQTQSETLQKRA